MSGVVPLGSRAVVTVGFVGTMTPHYRQAGIPFLRSQNVRPHRLDLSEVKYIDPAFDATISKSSLRAGDVVVVRTGQPGTAAVIPPDFGPANCADLLVVRPGPGLDPRWLSYYMNWAAARTVQAHAVGAVQQHFNVGAALKLDIPDLPLTEQFAVAEVLGALDDKVAANRRLVEAGDGHIEAVVSSHLTNKGPLWGSVDLTFGEAFKGTQFSEVGVGRPLIRIRDLKSQKCQVWTTEIRPRERSIHPGDLLVGMDAEFRPTRWSGPIGLLNQRVLAVRSDRYGLAIAREMLRAPLARIERSKSGTTVIHLNKTDLQEESVLRPSETDLPALRAFVDPLWDRLVAAELESVRLAATRDELLPLLMNGSITVKDAEARIEGEV